MRYVVYCDESRHDRSAANPYMAIGGLWVPAESRTTMSRAFRQLRMDGNVKAEVKWCKTSQRVLESYKGLVDFFFEQADLRYRVIVVDQRQVDYDRYHDGDRELGFYKFYYEMLIKWLEQGNEYLVLLDFKQNRGADRYRMLRQVLERSLLGVAWVRDLTVVDSAQTPLVQLCDLLTGAVAAAWCEALRPDSAKAALARHIAGKLRWPDLRRSTGKTAAKFNVFDIQLSGGAGDGPA